MPTKVCNTCSKIGCTDHQRKPNGKSGTHWSPGRDSTTQARFRKQVLERDGHRCTAIEDGVRCRATTDLQAHHTEPWNDDPATGLTLCRTHHRIVDDHAR